MANNELNLDAERERFETWAQTCDGNCMDTDLGKLAPGSARAVDGEVYINRSVERDWMVWQARASLAAQAEPSGARGALSDSDRGNIELVIARLEQIADTSNGHCVIQMAEEALVCTRAIEARILGQQGGGDAARWLRTVESTPEDGFYVALYRDDKSLVVGMCAYGETEFYDEEKDEDIAEIGWTVFETLDGGTVERRCQVVAYLPDNYNMKSLATVRAAIQAQAGDAREGGGHAKG